MLFRKPCLPKHAVRSFYQILKFLKKEVGFKPQESDYKVHLIVGDPKVGKTALLYDSQLTYRFYKKLASSYQHKTINWWLTQDQIYLDFPGKAIVDEKQCLHWLKLIKKSGLSLCLASCCWVVRAQDLLHDKTLLHNKSWQRFNRLCHKVLGRVPATQLIITQTDQLLGFEAFFESYIDKQDNTQPLGYMLPTQWSDETIQQSHQQMINNLENYLVEQLQDETQHSHTQLAKKDFVAQFQALLQQLEANLKIIKRNNGIKGALEGVFFTGVLSQHAKRVFSDAVLQYILPAQPVINSGRFKRASLKVISILFLLLVAGGAAYVAWKMQSMSQSIRHLETDLQHYQALQEDTQTAKDRLKSIEYLKKARQQVTTLQNNIWAQAYGKLLNRLQRQVEQADQQLLHKHLRPIFQNHLEAALQNPQRPAITYACLTAYLMLQQQLPVDKSYLNRVIKYLQQTDAEFALTPEVARGIQHALSDRVQHLLGNEHYQYQLVKQLKEQFNQLSAINKAQIVLGSYFIDRQPLTLNLPDHHDQSFQLIRIDKDDTSIKAMHTADSWQLLSNKHLFVRSALTITQGSGISEGHVDQSTAQLAKQLKQQYFKQYAHDWRNFRQHIDLRQPKTIKQVQKALKTLNSQPNVMIQLAELFHNQIPHEVKPYLDQKTHSLIGSINNNDSSMQVLEQYFHDLQHYLKGADNPYQAFQISRDRMLNEGKGDAIAQMNQYVPKTPVYWRSWIEDLTKTIWQLLLQHSADYINQQWSANVWPDYKHQLQHHYPFTKQANRDVKAVSFTHFFGPHQTMMNFYHHYLQAFVSTSQTKWRYRSINGEHLPLKKHSLILFRKSHHIARELFDDYGGLQLQLGLQLSAKMHHLHGMLLQWSKQTLRLTVPEDNALKHLQQMTWQYDEDQPKLKVFYLTDKGDKQQQTYEGFWGVWHWLDKYQSQSIKPHYWALQGQSGVYQHKIVLHFSGKHPMFKSDYFQNLPFRRQL